jgi:hypothetical protein
MYVLVLHSASSPIAPPIRSRAVAATDNAGGRPEPGAGAGAGEREVDRRQVRQNWLTLLPSIAHLCPDLRQEPRMPFPLPLASKVHGPVAP